MVTCVEDTFYKISSEALLVLQQLIRVIRPQPGADAVGCDPKQFVRKVRWKCCCKNDHRDLNGLSADFDSSSQVFPVTMKLLRATDIDQEVKERVIVCMGHMVCHLSDHLEADTQEVLAVFLERLKNEITRLTTVRTLSLVAASTLKVKFVLPQR